MVSQDAPDPPQNVSDQAPRSPKNVDARRPQRLARSRWLVCLVPIVLVLIAMSSRYLSDFDAPALPVTPISIKALAPAARKLHMDTRSWLSQVRAHRNRKRTPQGDLDAESNTTPSPTTSNPDPTASTSQSASAVDTAAPAVPDTPLPVPTPFPQPFDESLSYNFSTISCQTFFNNFTQSVPFRECRPFSLLVSTSAEFIAAQSNLTLLTAIVGGTCNTVESEDQCDANMNWFADAIQTSCSTDLKDRNALAIQALQGFESYSMFRKAGCLRNLRTNTYCYPEAISDTSPADAYYYALPLGTPVPNNTVPSCSPCLQSLLTVFAAGASDSRLLISKTYGQAAQLANNACGPTFAKVAPQAATTGAARRAFQIDGISIAAWSSIAVLLFGVLLRV